MCNALRCRNPAPNSRRPHPHPPRCSAQSRCATGWRARRWPRPSARTWAGRWSQARHWPVRRHGAEWRGMARGANMWHGVQKRGTKRCVCAAVRLMWGGATQDGTGTAGGSCARLALAQPKVGNWQQGLPGGNRSCKTRPGLTRRIESSRAVLKDEQS